MVYNFDMKIKLILRKNVAIFAGFAIASGGLIGLYSLGKSYINNSKYDFMMSINKKTNMNYTTSSGDISRIALNFQDGIIVNSISDYSSIQLINDPLSWGDEELRQKYMSATTQQDTFERVKDINVADGDEEKSDLGDPTLSDSQFSIAKKAWVSENNENWKFFMRPDLKWSTGEEILASNFGYALYKILNARNGSSARYMPAKYINLKGAKTWEDNQNNAIDTGEEEDWLLREKMFYDDQNPTKNFITKEANKGTAEEAAFVFNNEEGWFMYQTNDPNPVFHTILQNPSFMPINQVWLEGNNMSIRDMGTNKETLSTYGAFNVDSFDPDYGLELSKNETYHNSDLIASNTMALRNIKDQSTQLAMFKSGELTTFHVDEIADKSVLLQDSYASEFIDWQLSNPTTRYTLFNLSPNNTRPNAKYYKNPNFRKAIFTAFDRSKYIELTASERAVPTGLVTPSKFGTFPDTSIEKEKRTIVDYAYNAEIGYTEAKRYLAHHDEETREIILATDQSKMDGKDYVRGTTAGEATNYTDPIVDKALIQHYWNLFEADMKAIGESIPTNIELEYATTLGDTDPVIQTMRQAFHTHDLPIKINIKTIVGSLMPSWRSSDYDLIEIGWNPDVGSPWGSLSIYNGVDLSRSFNLSVSWNFWTGSWHSYGNTYTTAQKEQIRTNWAADGMFIPTKANPLTNSDWVYNKANMEQLIPDTILADKEEGLEIMNGLHDFMEDSIDIGTTQTPGKLSVNIDGGTGEDRGYETQVVSGTTQTEVYSLDETDQARLFVIFESINQEGMGSMQIRNALPTGVPNKSPFISALSLGYPVQIYAYNLDLKTKYGYPGEDAILKYR